MPSAIPTSPDTATTWQPKIELPSEKLDDRHGMATSVVPSDSSNSFSGWRKAPVLNSGCWASPSQRFVT